MPYYDHNKDYPFAAFITNLGKYNEGELVGEWVKFPTTAEELKEVFKRIGIGQKDDFGQPYEEWFITDYDCYVDGLYSKLGEYENLDELNYLASKLDEMSESEYAQFQAGMEMGDHCGSLQEIINLTENLDCYEVYPDIHDYDDLGRYYIEELDVMQVPEHLQNYIDYEAYGRDVALEENGTFTDQGYVRDTGDSFHEYYDGERGSIPDEYRVMAFQDDLPEEEKSEWAMDIAFDMDEFFRQNDPQYAAEHPEAHAAKEELYESLMAGRISTLDEKLAALGQTQEDYLPSEIEKFKDATGYDLTQRRSRLLWMTRLNPAWMKCWLLRKERNGSMRQRQPPMCRLRRISWHRPRPFRIRLRKTAFPFISSKAAMKRWTIVSSRWTVSTATVFL